MSPVETMSGSQNIPSWEIEKCGECACWRPEEKEKRCGFYDLIFGIANASPALTTPIEDCAHVWSQHDVNSFQERVRQQL